MADTVTKLPAKPVVADRFDVDNDRRLIHFSGRATLSIQRDNVAVPFALLKHLVASLTASEARVELESIGFTVASSKAT